METIDQALAELQAGRPVVVVDGEDRENEGDLIVAADRVTAATMAFLVRHTSGFVCVALPEPECERLDLPPMHWHNADSFGTAYRVTVDAAQHIGTGISGRDRAHTARLLAAADTQPDELTRPGHIVPLAARPGGVLERAGHTEAAVDLTRLAGLRPASVLCEVVSAAEPTRMARRPELVGFAAEHSLAMITIEDLVAYRHATETIVVRVTSAQLPIKTGAVQAIGFREQPGGAEHVAFVAGEARDGDVPVHVHAECVLGDVFGSRACDCGGRLDAAVCEVTAAKRGIVIYLRPTSDATLLTGRSTGAQARSRPGWAGEVSASCPRSSGGVPTGELSGAADSTVVAAILADLGVTTVRHLHNPVAMRGSLDTALAAASAPSPAGAPSGAVA